MAHAYRVNGQFLPHHIQQAVKLVGRVVGSGMGNYSLQLSDGMNVTVIGQGGADGTIWEVTGKVESDMSITEYSKVQFSDTFDFDNYNKVVEWANTKHAALFHPQ